jgi:pentatricopeptide repeat protein
VSPGHSPKREPEAEQRSQRPQQPTTLCQRLQTWRGKLSLDINHDQKPLNSLLDEINQWSKGLSKANTQRDTSLRLVVHELDVLVRALVQHKDPHAPVTQHALHTALSLYAKQQAHRPASPEPSQRALALFQCLQIPWSSIGPRERNVLIRQRRQQYQAVLLAIRHCREASQAPDPEHVWNKLTEEATRFRLYNLITTNGFNMVVAGMHRNPNRARHFWDTQLGRYRLTANAGTYDALVSVYQNQRHQGNWQAARQVWLDNWRAYIATPQPELRPMPVTLSRVLGLARDKPWQARNMLHEALHLQSQLPFGRRNIPMVDSGCVLHVLNALVQARLVVEAEQLLEDVQHRYYNEGATELQLNPKHFVVLLSGYTQDLTIQGLTRAEAFLKIIEKQFLLHPSQRMDAPSASEPFDQTAYNIMATAYLNANRQDAVSQTERLMERMSNHAGTFQNCHLYPDRITYSILMRALVQERKLGFHHKVECLLLTMLDDLNTSRQPDVATFMVALEAWYRSDDPNAIQGAERLFRRIIFPVTRCYNFLLKFYVRDGLGDKAEAILKEMKDGKKPECVPDKYTYWAVLQTWRNSSHPERFDRAKRIFKLLLSLSESTWNDVALTILLSTLASTEVPANKNREAQELLDLNEQTLRHSCGSCGEPLSWSVPVVIAFIRACGETKGSEDDFREALRNIYDKVKLLGGKATPEVYTAVLDACSKLSVDPVQLGQEVCFIFEQCIKHGLVSYPLLNALRRVAKPDIYLYLTLQDSKNAPDMENIPDEWKKNVVATVTP